jgi:MyTH4 domain
MYRICAAALDDMDLVVVVQTLLHKCMDNEGLCNECFLQLIKQTTDTKTGNEVPYLLSYLLMVICSYGCSMLLLVHRELEQIIHRQKSFQVRAVALLLDQRDFNAGYILVSPILVACCYL